MTNPVTKVAILRAAGLVAASSACDAHERAAPLATIRLRRGARLTDGEMAEHVAWRKRRDVLHDEMIAADDALAMAANRAAFEDGFEG